MKKYFWLLFIIVVAGYYFRGLVIPSARRQIPPVSTASNIYKIGILVVVKAVLPGVEGFRSKMQSLGWEEGKNITYIVRVAKNKEEYPRAIADFIKDNVDLIHLYSTPAALAAYRQTKTIPIVFGGMADPMASGIIDSLQRPGRNVTGVSTLSVSLAAKRVKFLVEAVPAIKKIAFPYAPEDIWARRSYEAAASVVPKLNIQIVPYPVSKKRDAESTARAITHKDVDGIVLSPGVAVISAIDAYIDQAKKERLPLVAYERDTIERGALLGYGMDIFANGQQAAEYADKILKGASPAELPIAIPRKLLLMLNLKTSREIGVTFPETIIRKADLIINDSP